MVRLRQRRKCNMHTSQFLRGMGLGIAVGTAIGLPAPYALLSSAISMIGGHGAAGSYGSTFESLGYSAAMGVGAAAATFGLISGVC